MLIKTLITLPCDESRGCPALTLHVMCLQREQPFSREEAKNSFEGDLGAVAPAHSDT